MATGAHNETTDLHTSPLHDRHVSAGAKFAPFAGWSMPVEYAGVKTEHAAVRTAVGLFDVSHLGTLEVRGPGVAEALNTVFTNDLGRIGTGKAQYSLLCNAAGMVVDDVIVYLLADDFAVIVPNAANAAEVADAVAAALPDGAEMIDAHRDTAVIAVQGPRSAELLVDAGIESNLDYMQAEVVDVLGAEVVVCRTGYTGERGYELLVPSDHAVAVWDLLLRAGERYGVQPCGLGARDTLRTEMGYPLHGQDLGGDIGPLEAGLSWAVGWSKTEFNGREALLAKKGSALLPKLHGLVLLDRGVPRPGMAVHLMPDGPQVGTLTSGTFSPTLHTGIGLALLDASINDGDEVSVNVRGRWLTARVTKPPLVPAHVRD